MEIAVLPSVNMASYFPKAYAFFVLVASNKKPLYFFLAFLMNFICHGFEPFLTLFLQFCFTLSSSFHLVLRVYVPPNRRLAPFLWFIRSWVRDEENQVDTTRGKNAYGIGTSEDKHTALSRTLFPNAYHFLLLQRSFLRRVFLGKFLADTPLSLGWEAPSVPWMAPQLHWPFQLQHAGFKKLPMLPRRSNRNWAFIHSFIPSFTWYLLSAYCMSQALFWALGISQGTKDKNPALLSLTL